MSEGRNLPGSSQTFDMKHNMSIVNAFLVAMSTSVQLSVDSSTANPCSNDDHFLLSSVHFFDTRLRT